MQKCGFRHSHKKVAMNKLKKREEHFEVYQLTSDRLIFNAIAHRGQNSYSAYFDGRNSFAKKTYRGLSLTAFKYYQLNTISAILAEAQRRYSQRHF